NAPVTPLEGWLRIPAAVIYALSVLALIAFSVILFKRTADRRQLFSFLLVWLVLGTVALLYSLSEAGEGRGLTVRYVLPLYIPLAIAAGLLLETLWRRARLAAVLVALLLVLFQVSGYYLPWTPQRRYLRDLLRQDAELVRFLDKNQIRWICGNYWVVYP